jgi:hypothetical protein
MSQNRPAPTAAARACEGVTAFGRSDAAPALRRAAAHNPAAIVLVTAKGWELDDAFVESALLARGHATTKIHTVSIGGAGDASRGAYDDGVRGTSGRTRAASGGVGGAIEAVGVDVAHAGV